MPRPSRCPVFFCGENMNLKGRRRIYTDFSNVNEDNITQILRDSMPIHDMNRQDMIFLLNYEKGEQPLMREKVARDDIDIHAIMNLSNLITTFKLGYVWGYPISTVQRSDKLPKDTDSDKDNDAITLLNDFYYSEEKDSKDQEMARFVEICGLGYQMIDIKRDYEEGDSPFDLTVLSPLYTFVVYSSDIKHEPVLGVTYTEDRLGNKKQFTCVAKDAVYIVDSQYRLNKDGTRKSDRKGNDIVDYNVDSGSIQANPLGEIYIGECDRANDRTGCFERLIDDMDALNILSSDLCNDVSQNCQSIWGCVDVDFEHDESGNVIPPVSGQWVLMKSNPNSSQKPSINPLTIPYDYNGVLENIKSKHDMILERAFVPRQSDPGGGSTGSAMSLSSGWSAAESAACMESLVLKRFFQWRNRIAIKACKKSAMIGRTEIDDLSPSDVDVRFVRQKTFDMATKVNSLSTMLNCMVDPKTAMSTVDLFPNLAEAIDDSIENMKKYQENLLKEKNEEPQEEEFDENGKPIERTMQDSSDQTGNSPIEQML